MKVWLEDLKVLSVINRAEEITDNTHFITDVEYDLIKLTQDNNGFIWIAEEGGKPKVKCSGLPPSPLHRFNESRKEWELDPELVRIDHDKKVAEVWEMIKAEREYRNTLGFYVESVDKWFHSDQPAINNYQIIGINVLSGQHKPVMWKTMDETWVSMTEDLFKQIVQSMADHGAYNFKVAEQHYQKLKVCEDPYTYDYKTNWKPNYQPVQSIQPVENQ